MLKIKDLRTKPSKTTEERIILAIAANYGITKVSRLEKMGFRRRDILLHARKSTFIVYDKVRDVLKLVKEGKPHASVIENWREGNSIQTMVCSLLWKDFSMSKEEILQKIEPLAKAKGLDLSNFKNSNSNFSWYKKVIKKNAKDRGIQLKGMQ